MLHVMNDFVQQDAACAHVGNDVAIASQVNGLIGRRKPPFDTAAMTRADAGSKAFLRDEADLRGGERDRLRMRALLCV